MSRAEQCEGACGTWQLSWRYSSTHQLVLVGGDGGEDGLGEDVGAVLLLVQVRDGAAVLAPLDEVDARLVPVHRVEHDLQHKHKQNKNSQSQYINITTYSFNNVLIIPRLIVPNTTTTS